MEREGFYNRNGWGIEAIGMLRNEGRNVEEEIISRERDIQRQWEDGKIRETKYNKRYKDIERGVEGPGYLREEDRDKAGTGDRIRALVKLRCGNMEGINKYWLEHRLLRCIFCGTGRDCIKHYVYEYSKGYF